MMGESKGSKTTRNSKNTSHGKVSGHEADETPFWTSLKKHASVAVTAVTVLLCLACAWFFGYPVVGDFVLRFAGFKTFNYWKLCYQTSFWAGLGVELFTVASAAGVWYKFFS